MLSNDSTTPADLSPIARCLQIAAQRGRALRLAREAAQQQAADTAPRQDDAQAQPDDQHNAQRQQAGT